MTDSPKSKDPFVAMVTARAEVDLRLSDFHPRSMLAAPAPHCEAEIPGHRLSQSPGRARATRSSTDHGRVWHRARYQYHHAYRQDGARNDPQIPQRRAGSFRNLRMDGLERRAVAGLFRAQRGSAGRISRTWRLRPENLEGSGHDSAPTDGSLLRIDDQRLDPLYEKAAELGVPIMYHIADPDAFFLPIDAENERYEELAAHPEWSYHGSHYGKLELLAQRDRVIARHPKTTFVGAHVAEHRQKSLHGAIALREQLRACREHRVHWDAHVFVAFIFGVLGGRRWIRDVVHDRDTEFTLFHYSGSESLVRRCATGFRQLSVILPFQAAGHVRLILPADRQHSMHVTIPSIRRLRNDPARRSNQFADHFKARLAGMHGDIDNALDATLVHDP